VRNGAPHCSNYFWPYLIRILSIAIINDNRQGILRVLEPAAIRAQEMYQSRAYVHQYTAHGLEDFDFEGSFVGMERLISDYSGLSW
jgi:tubulin delta